MKHKTNSCPHCIEFKCVFLSLRCSWYVFLVVFDVLDMCLSFSLMFLICVEGINISSRFSCPSFHQLTTWYFPIHEFTRYTILTRSILALENDLDSNSNMLQNFLRFRNSLLQYTIKIYFIMISLLVTRLKSWRFLIVYTLYLKCLVFIMKYIKNLIWWVTWQK